MNTSPIRVLMITPFPEYEDKVVGGVAGVSYYLSQHLSEIQDLDLEVLVPESSFEQPQKRTLSGVDVHYLPKIKQHLVSRYTASKIAKLIGEYVQRGGYDIVHVQGAAEWSSCISAPVVVTVHGINEEDMLYRGRHRNWRKMIWPIVHLLEQRKRSRIENLIVISPYVRKVLGPSFVGRSWAIENPVREDFFTMAAQPQVHRILFAGVVSPRKNVHRLIQAVAVLRSELPDITLKIAGDQADKSYAAFCQSEVSRLQLQETVAFTGCLTVAEMQEQLQHAHVLALTSLQETAPLSVEEAMAVGIPVVASNVGGMPSLIKDGETGFLVDPLDTDSIVQGLQSAMLLNLDQVRTASRAIAHKRFRGKAVATKTVAVYKEVLNTALRKYGTGI